MLSFICERAHDAAGLLRICALDFAESFGVLRHKLVVDFLVHVYARACHAYELISATFYDTDGIHSQI